MSFAVASYGASALAYGLLTIVLVVSRDYSRQGQRVLLAVAGTAAWGAAAASLLVWQVPSYINVVLIPDALRTLVWIICLLAILPGKLAWNSQKGVLALVALGLAATAVVTPFVPGAGEYLFIALLALSVIGCLAVEQILRNSTAEQKRVLRSFLWTIAAILIYDLFVFSDAVLFSSLNTGLWAPRGFLAAIGVPFFLLAAKRHPDWAETLFISREFVFYSATLLAVGLYLIGMAIGGFVIREQGGQWGAAIQLGYLIAALAVLAFILSSARLKAQFRVFISKHFYRNRYDYRDEWLRLIRTLSESDEALPLDQRSIKALCEIVGSTGGQLWLDRDGRSVYEPFAAWQVAFPLREYDARSPLVRFLKELQWVVDSRQYERDPEHYQHAFRGAEDDLPPASLVVPLMHQKEMLGFASLSCGPDLRELNFEDHDLLKTAGRQVAAFLAHDLARERLAETQQFDAYNRLSAFVMHDLKNVLAQQALLVDNAKKFRDRPDFIDDMIVTVDNGVQRMRRLLRQLTQATTASKEQRVELSKLILRAVSACADHGRVPCSFVNQATFWVRANDEQLTSVITHVIQNAQDATPQGAGVTVALREGQRGTVLIEVRDSGSGMSEEFIRRRLFKPFQSTKGTSGMGIGAYQAREIVRGLGGEMSVTSSVGKGTLVVLSLPQEPAASAQSHS